MDELKLFPEGCQGCGGACCKDEKCPDLLDDGRCGVQVRDGYEAKPQRCKDAAVGEPQCVSFREQHGND